MENLKVMTHDQFGKLSIIMIDDSPWFVGKEVSAALGYANEHKAISMHVDDEDKKILDFKGFSHFGKSLWSGNDYSNKTVINESGLYSLILSSKLPSAKQFKHWVTSEVLPSVRRTGSYRIQANPLYHPDFPEYKYQNKLYDGETVLSTKDLEYFLDLAPDQIKKIRDALMTEGIHYFKLSGEELKKFKVKHRLVRSTADTMYLYNYEGYHKLELYYAEYSNNPTRKQKPQPSFVSLDRELPTIPPEDMKQVTPNIKTKVLMNNVKEHCMAANGLAQTLLSVYTRGELKVIRKALVNEIFALETMAKQIEGIKF